MAKCWEGKKYKLEKSENFDEYMKELGKSNIEQQKYLEEEEKKKRKMPTLKFCFGMFFVADVVFHLPGKIFRLFWPPEEHTPHL